MPLPLNCPGVSLFAGVVAASITCLALSASAPAGDPMAGDPLTGIKVNEVESTAPPTSSNCVDERDSYRRERARAQGQRRQPHAGDPGRDHHPGRRLPRRGHRRRRWVRAGTLPDAARVFMPDGTTLVDSYSWTSQCESDEAAGQFLAIAFRGGLRKGSCH